MEIDVEKGGYGAKHMSKSNKPKHTRTVFGRSETKKVLKDVARSSQIQ